MKYKNIVFFDTCKRRACCYGVGLPTLSQVQWSETSVGRFEGIAWLARYPTFRVLCMLNNRCNGKRIFQNIESSSHFNNILHVRSTNACRIRKKNDRHRALSESVRYWPWPVTFLSFDVLGVFQSSSFIFFRSWMHLWFKGVKIFLQK